MDALAEAIDSAPQVEGVYHCPAASPSGTSVVLAFTYPLGGTASLHASFTVTVHISFTGCRWMWVVGSPSSSTRWWLTSEVLRTLTPLGRPRPDRSHPLRGSPQSTPTDSPSALTAPSTHRPGGQQPSEAVATTTRPSCHGPCSNQPKTPCAGLAIRSCLGAISFLNARDGYGLYPLDQKFDRFAVVETSDAGRTWHKVGNVTNPYLELGAVGLTGDLVFVDRRDGLMLGSTRDLLVTHDGGRKWAAVPLGAPVFDVSLTGRVLWAATDSCRFTSETSSQPPCGVGLERSADAGRSWTPVSLPSEPYEVPKVVSEGNGTLLVGAWGPTAYQDAQSGQLLVSTDGGATWAVHPMPCTQGYEFGGNLFAAQNSAALWLTCTGQGSGGEMATVLLRSTDEGISWTPESGCAIGSPGDHEHLAAGPMRQALRTRSSGIPPRLRR